MGLRACWDSLCEVVSGRGYDAFAHGSYFENKQGGVSDFVSGDRLAQWPDPAEGSKIAQDSALHHGSALFRVGARHDLPFA